MPKIFNPEKHIVVLLDIDDTLVRLKNKQPQQHNFIIKYTAGRNHWYERLRTFKETALTHGIIVHYGIATSKPRYRDANNAANNIRGDYISAQIIGEIGESGDSVVCYPEANSLKEFLEPELIFFVGQACYDAKIACEAGAMKYDDYRAIIQSCKAKDALPAAKKHIETTYNVSLPEQDIFLIDDYDDLCEVTSLHGFNTICVGEDFSQTTLQKQRQVLDYIFKTILPGQYYEKNDASPLFEDNLTALNKEWAGEIQKMIDAPVEEKTFPSPIPQPPIEVMSDSNLIDNNIKPRRLTALFCCCLFGKRKVAATSEIEMPELNLNGTRMHYE